ncbi:hypothetical protein EUGRSUZ_B00193 [Eucalyptus grandis]|uniref:Uncharacterized protein n=2 Tax=Eucalyptus grandis TaxID=71139 RepID=A0ACC3LM09_EUCGR|nr:hypothetical protein EUGRSUZ_B00193 [Eucalyptus grandis]
MEHLHNEPEHKGQKKANKDRVEGSKSSYHRAEKRRRAFQRPVALHTMEALGLPSLGPLTISQSATSRRVRTASSLRTKTHSRGFMELPPLGLNSSLAIRHKKRSVIRMIADTDDYDLRQMKDMAAARKRWDSLIREQKVKCLTPREAGYAIQLSDKTLLDVRPSVERSKAWVKGSTWIPIFDGNSGFDPGTLSRKMTNFVMGGWWSGAPTLSHNKQFLPSIEEKFPKDSDLIVACQKGLRSLAACELLYNAGYRNLFWVQGGLEASEEEVSIFYDSPSMIRVDKLVMMVGATIF